MELQLSVIIVNYNVRAFLEQCLYSLRHALQGIEAEVWVVDNASNDGSVGYLQPLFPGVQWILNEENEGFSKANNRALAKCSGAFVLFLNPDTLLPEDCIEKCLRFMYEQKDAGALGIKMLDGNGKFLPESKRAFPGPLISFYKLIGLTALFPKSKIFARYYLGHLSIEKNHAVDVLAGAFMLLRKEVLDSTGGFDERFFMYGEDIDLSYRVYKTPLPDGTGHWNNYYFTESPIIHFKGESTKKGSLNYVLLFYKAMVQFVKKHYASGRAGIFIAFIYIAIAARAFISLSGRIFRHIGLPLLDLIITAGSLYGVWRIWALWIRPDVIWMPQLVNFALPVFAGIFLLIGAVAGLYSKWYLPRRAWGALLLAILSVLAVYSLLPEAWRFSRGIVLFGGLLSGVIMVGMRSLMVKAGWLNADNGDEEVQQTIVAGTQDNYHEIEKLYTAHLRQNRLLGRLSPNEPDTDALMTLEQYFESPESLPVKEIIFCPGPSISMKRVISFLATSTRVRYKFHYAGSGSIIGSDDSNTAGETLGGPVQFNLAKGIEQNRKRVLDILVALFLLGTWPVQVFLVKKPVGLLTNIWQVLTGRASWVGYLGHQQGLPALQKGILGTNGLPIQNAPLLNKEAKDILDARYALDYHYWTDISLIRKGYRFLGARV
jgi:O-antigen biosynthesis protein